MEQETKPNNILYKRNTFNSQNPHRIKIQGWKTLLHATVTQKKHGFYPNFRQSELYIMPDQKTKKVIT